MPSSRAALPSPSLAHRVTTEPPALLLERVPLRHRQLLAPVMQRPGDYVLSSLRGISRSLKVAPATISRIVKAMGFDGYHAFQAYLHEWSVAYATNLEVMQRVPGTSSLGTLIKRSVAQDRNNLNRLEQTLDPQRLIAVARRLQRARRIVLLGGDMATSLVKFLEYNLAMLNLDVVAAVGGGTITHRVRHLDTRDAALAISYGRGLRQTVEGLKQARHRGAFAVGVSDSFVSPLAGVSDEFFVTPTDRISFADSYVAGMAFLNALLVAVANVRRKQTVKLLRMAAQEQRSGSRWYASS